MTTLSSVDLSKILFDVTKTAVGQWIHEAIKALTIEIGEKNLPLALQDTTDIRHLKKTGLYRRLLQAGLKEPVAQSIIYGKTIESYKAALHPEVFRKAKNVLNEFSAREKWEPFDYQELGALITKGNPFSTRLEALKRLTARTSAKAASLGLVVSLNGEYKRRGKRINISLVAEGLRRSGVPFTIISRSSGYQTIYIVPSDLELVVEIFSSESLSTQDSLRVNQIFIPN